MNKVYWITGLSGAGKSTIGMALYTRLKRQHDNIVLLDGDVLRNVFGDRYGYSNEERFSLAMTYSKLCKMLNDQGHTVICCTIAMFDAVREWNRSNIRNYVEIYLRVPMPILRMRDQKGLYSASQLGNELNLVGIDIKMEKPKTPDIIIDNDGSFSVEECVNRIMEYTVDDDFYADRKYWDAYYHSNPPIDFPSNFAEYISKYLKKDKSIVDLGCGNGRDSLFFSEKGLIVTAIDGSENAIYKLKKENGHRRISFVCGDFVDSPSVYSKNYDYFYSRFSIHSISDDKQHTLLKNIYAYIQSDGYLFIEVRGIYDDLYGKGVMVAKNSFFYDNHYRRFIDKKELDNELIDLGFQIILSEENRGFAPFGDSDPIVLRVIAKK